MGCWGDKGGSLQSGFLCDQESQFWGNFSKAGGLWSPAGVQMRLRCLWFQLVVPMGFGKGAGPQRSPQSLGDLLFSVRNLKFYPQRETCCSLQVLSARQSHAGSHSNVDFIFLVKLYNYCPTLLP